MKIVYSCSGAFTPLLIKSIRSVIKHNPTADFYVVCKEKINTPEMDQLEAQLEKHIKYITVKQDRQISRNGSIPQSWEGNAKLFFTQLPFDKIIYLGADTIVQDNLDYLWDMPCEYINACPTHNTGKKQASELGIPFYINVDVMVMNLNAMRADNFTEKVFAKQDFNVSLWCNEETLINGNFNDKIKLLPQKYNYAFNRKYDTPMDYKDASIIHFIGRQNKLEMLKYDTPETPKSLEWNFDNLKDIKDFIKGKTIAVVGNAKSIFEKQHGADIDAHDIIMRFNLGLPNKPVAQGTRTDILITARGAENPFIKDFKAKYIIKRVKRLPVGTPYFFAKKDRLRMKQGGPWRSSGFYGINLALASMPAKVDLYGFDFGLTPTYYNEVGFITPHDYDYEGVFVRKAEKEGQLKIY